MNARPGYWDIETCTWVGAQSTHVVPPGPDAPVEDSVPAPRTRAETASGSTPVAAESTAG